MAPCWDCLSLSDWSAVGCYISIVWTSCSQQLLANDSGLNWWLRWGFEREPFWSYCILELGISPREEFPCPQAHLLEKVLSPLWATFSLGDLSPLSETLWASVSQSSLPTGKFFICLCKLGRWLQTDQAGIEWGALEKHYVMSVVSMNDESPKHRCSGRTATH